MSQGPKRQGIACKLKSHHLPLASTPLNIYILFETFRSHSKSGRMNITPKTMTLASHSVHLRHLVIFRQKRPKIGLWTYIRPDTYIWKEDHTFFAFIWIAQTWWDTLLGNLSRTHWNNVNICTSKKIKVALEFLFYQSFGLHLSFFISFNFYIL